MSITLYRKYRPQLFADLIGQDLIKQTLQNEIKNGQLAHAYLFSGPRGLGKTTTSRLLAKAVNCQKRPKKQAEPCNECQNCQAIMASRSLDLIEIDAASNRGINEIRQLKEHIGFTPSGSNYRVFIIDEVHMLTPEAFNALLKTLEEPPPHAIFILATTQLHKVPETIISRCQTFVFRRVAETELMSRLAHIADQENIKVAEPVLRQVAHLSGGFIRDAESLLGQLLSLGEKHIDQDTASLVLPVTNAESVVNFLSYLRDLQAGQAMVLLSELIEQGVDLEFFTKELLEALRQLLLAEYDVLTGKADERMLPLHRQFSLPQLQLLIKLTDQARQGLKETDLPQLPLELMAAEYVNSQSAAGGAAPELSGHGEPGHPAGAVPDKQSAPKKSVKNVAAKQETKVLEIKKTRSQPSSSVSLKSISHKWSEVIKISQQYNHSLPLTLRMAHPISLDQLGSDVLELGFGYEVHLNRLQEPAISQKLIEILGQIFGRPMTIQCRLLTDEETARLGQRDEQGTDKKEEKFIKEALKVFGGQVAGEEVN